MNYTIITKAYKLSLIVKLSEHLLPQIFCETFTMDTMLIVYLLASAVIAYGQG